MTWIVIAALTAIAAAALLAPLLRQRRDSATRSEYDREVYRDQLAELERDKARGIISEAEAKSARAEIARRMLATERADEPSAADKRGVRPFAIAVAVAAPIFAVALYVATGSPGLPGLPLAARHAGDPAGADARTELTQRVATLAQRLQQNPDDAEGWLLLARSLTALERHAEAATAWRQVVRLAPGDPDTVGSLAESLVQSASGVVTPEARAALERLRQAEPFDPRALFYLGLAEAQAGNAGAALQLWTDLIAVSPADAPWLTAVRDRISRTAAEARIDPAATKPSREAVQFAEAARQAPRGPSAADIEAMQRMSPEERQQAIRGMVEGLATRMESRPDDLDGWRRLGRAWSTLGERDKATAAYAKAAALAPNRVDVLSDYAGALLDGAEGEALPPDFVEVMRRILAIDPNHGDALWFTGLADAQAGRKDAAAAAWEKLLARLPADSREHAEVKQRLDELKAAN